MMRNNDARTPTSTIGSRGMALLTIAAIVTTGAAWGGDGFEIRRSTIDGGGTVSSSGGGFELSGTIGQPDAGVLVGGEFILSGGFWFPIEAGDCDTDGIIGLNDYRRMAACVTAPDGQLKNVECTCTDADGDEDTDLRDFATIQIEFGGR
jgi:hypothetical protein